MDKPTTGTEIKHDGLRALLLESLDLSERNLALEHGKDITAPIIILTDSANHLLELEEWVGPGKYPTLHTSKDGDIMRGVLELLHHRVSMGFPTFFVKVRAHRGEPFNEAADRIASMASE